MKAVLILLTGIATCTGILLVRRESAQRPADPVAQGTTLPLATTERPAATGEAVRDAALVDQDGRAFRLSDLHGQVVVLAFIYSHCNMPNMCPLTCTKIVETRALARKRGLSGVQFLLVSFDSAQDPPERLKEFARQYTSDLSSLRLATGSPAEVDPLCHQLSTYFRHESPTVFEHNIVVSIIGRDGTLRDNLFGNQWATDELVSAIERVARAQ